MGETGLGHRCEESGYDGMASHEDNGGRWKIQGYPSQAFLPSGHEDSRFALRTSTSLIITISHLSFLYVVTISHLSFPYSTNGCREKELQPSLDEEPDPRRGRGFK